MVKVDFSPAKPPETVPDAHPLGLTDVQTLVSLSLALTQQQLVRSSTWTVISDPVVVDQFRSEKRLCLLFIIKVHTGRSHYHCIEVLLCEQI